MSTFEDQLDSLRTGRSLDRIPVGAGSSAPIQIDTRALPASYTMGTDSFRRIKRSECAVNHPHSSSAEVKERVDLCLYSSSVPSWQVIGLNLHLPLSTNLPPPPPPVPEELAFMHNLLKTKHNLLYIRNQSVPRCKHFPPRL
jgi:hypothetical protein